MQKDEVLDASFMNCKMLHRFYEEQIADAKERGVLFSLHLKATMMKVSDPIMFGHCVKAYFKDVFAKYAGTFQKLGVDANNGLGDLYKKIATLPEEERKAIEADIKATYEKQPRMAMVDSHKGTLPPEGLRDGVSVSLQSRALAGLLAGWIAGDRIRNVII